MKELSRVQSRESSASGVRAAVLPSSLDIRPSTRLAFTLVEMLVTLALLSLIVLALMSVFNSTQAAFRAGLTETDILESGRMVMGLMASDLQGTSPSYGTNGTVGAKIFINPQFYRAPSPVNFYINANPYDPTHQPFVQSLPGTGIQRSNVVESFFMLSRQNVNGSLSWVATGYAVDPLSWPTNSLYRFTMVSNVMYGNPLLLFSNFFYTVNNYAYGLNWPYSSFNNTTNWTHLVDGVENLTVTPYDLNGLVMTNTYEYNYNGQIGHTLTNQNTIFFAPLSPQILPAALPVYGCYMFSNTVPASVEVNLGVMEDAVLQRAEGMSGAGQANYLSNHVGQVHLFRQRVWIRNMDPAAYQ